VGDDKARVKTSQSLREKDAKSKARKLSESSVPVVNVMDAKIPAFKAAADVASR
jgi:hypothetical protein